MEYILNGMMSVVVPPASMVMMALAWPTLSFLRAAEWAVKTFFREDMENKVVLITGASSAIGEQIAYEYARRKANLVLVARREHRLFGIRENACILGARQVLVIAEDVVKEDDCRWFVSDIIGYFGQLNHLVNTASLGHSFYFEDAVDTSIFPHLMDINFWGNVYPTYAALPYLRQSRGRVVVNASIESWLPMPRMGLYAAAKAAVINFYDTLRYEVKDDVGITLATHGWIGGDMSRGKVMLEEGLEMQWREEKEQIAYEYARRKANLVLVARREHRLFGIRENACILGARQVLVIAADVVKEDDCRRFVSDTIGYFGQLNHLVNTASLGHSFYFEDAVDTSIFPHLMDINFWGNVYPTYAALPYLRQSRGRVVVNASIESWLPMPRMGLYAAAKAAVINLYDTLRYEVKDDVGITLATHGWIGGDMSRGKVMLEEGLEMQWREEKEVSLTSAHVVEFAQMMVAGTCRGDAYVKYPSWYDSFLLYRVFVPDVLGWTVRLLLSSPGPRRHSLLPDTSISAGQPLLLEAPPVRKPAAAYSPTSTSPRKAE